MSGRVVPFYCPYCGDEDLRPHVSEAAAHGAWECRSCVRVFTVKFVGLLAGQRPGSGHASGGSDPGSGEGGGPGGRPQSKDQEETR
ncbi:MAG: hypothetical protein ACRDT8_11230 [Micromonosporaceae bacterium]